MAIWPFRRRAARKRPRSGVAHEDGDGTSASTRADGAVARAASKKQRTEPAKLQRRPRAHSFSPGRRDSIRVIQSPRFPDSTHLADVTDEDGATEWQRPPTLYHGNSLARRKSSKRRRDDHEREAEIKAMSALASSRLAATGTATRRSSKRAKTTSGPGQWEKPPSNVSLPIFDSIYSSQSSDSDCVSFKVSTLDALAPRPTLRCAANTRYAPSRASAPARSASQKKSIAERETIPEEALDLRKRVDDLADGLDASDLRELMERDNRRRERKRQHDQDRMERRLARRAEKQQREEAHARHSGLPTPPNLERGVLGRELVGLGIAPPSAVVTSSKKRESTGPDPMSDVEDTRPRPPQEVFEDAAETLQEDSVPEHARLAPAKKMTPPPEADEPVSALPHGSILTGLLRSKKSQSKSTLSSDKDKMLVDEEAPRKDSESGHKSTRMSIVSFLRRGVKGRTASGPSSFSNTSREEMQASASAQAQAEALAKLQGDDTASQPHYLASKTGASAPKRTRSRFREDLPDYPLSPPESVGQCPEREPPLPPIGTARSTLTNSQPSSPIDITAERSIQALCRRPTSIERLQGAVSPDPQLSMSLASIDSEGSWLSGRVGSNRRSTMRDSLARVARRDRPLSDSPASSAHEEAVTDDEYLSRLTANHRSSEVAAGRLSEDGRPSSDDEPMQEENVRWGAVGARPRVVEFHRHDRDTMRSREGLLNMYPDSEVEGDEVTSPRKKMHHPQSAEVLDAGSGTVQ
ncbi:hypothetical protein HIM_00695 [Hirsutella minnesotensis 3608]|nr:hypothetical protein HIM_00695 [Hirsutella minnesotensis 3608]